MQITISNFQVGRVPSGREFAELKTQLQFNQFEANLGQCGIRFRIYAFLYERDDGRDTFNQSPNPFPFVTPQGDRDDYVGWIGGQLITPANTNPVNLSFYREWDFGNQESGNEEYYAVIHAVQTPRLGRLVYGPEISIDLG